MEKQRRYKPFGKIKRQTRKKRSDRNTAQYSHKLVVRISDEHTHKLNEKSKKTGYTVSDIIRDLLDTLD